MSQLLPPAIAEHDPEICANLMRNTFGEHWGGGAGVVARGAPVVGRIRILYVGIICSLQFFDGVLFDLHRIICHSQSINQSVYSFQEQDKKARGALTIANST